MLKIAWSVATPAMGKKIFFVLRYIIVNLIVKCFMIGAGTGYGLKIIWQENGRVQTPAILLLAGVSSVPTPTTPPTPTMYISIIRVIVFKKRWVWSVLHRP
jgi:hypothetical protein